MDPKPRTFRFQRLKLVWLLAVPFFWAAKPSWPTLLCGGSLALVGLLLRALAAGSIHKDRELATGGPYALLRHPLYGGSFLVGLGFSVAGGRWWFMIFFLAVFGWLYGITILAEERELRTRFGEDHEAYASRVPLLLPRRLRSGSFFGQSGFRMQRYRRNKEWQAALVTLMGFGVLMAKLWVSR